MVAPARWRRRVALGISKRGWGLHQGSWYPDIVGRSFQMERLLVEQGRLTAMLMNSLHNYYGDVIRKNAGDLDGMMKGVHATLLHCNSTDVPGCHGSTAIPLMLLLATNLCPPGENSWCNYQVAMAKHETYHHTHPPIPEAIVQLLKPIYARLGKSGLTVKVC